MVKERSIPMAVILYFVTCGIYYLYYLSVATTDVDIVSNNPQKRSGGTVVLLTILTCGLYGIYWWYKQGEFMEKANNESGVASSSNSVLYLLLALFGFSIINVVILQSDLNKYANKN